jgi:ATP-dependent DNA helicase RecG
MVSEELLKSWLNEISENEQLEFKEAKSSYDKEKLFRYCVALSNEGGGHLVFGVSDAIPR